MSPTSILYEQLFVQAAWVPDAATPLMFGNDDPGSCPTLLDAIDTDLTANIFIAGRTSSITLTSGVTTVACLDPEEGYAGYVTSYTDQAISWSKYFFGNYVYNPAPSDLDLVEAMPWVGLSRTAIPSGVTTIETNFVGFLVQMTTADFVGLLDGVDGSIQMLQEIISSPVSTFVVSDTGANILLQNLNNNGFYALSNHRIFMGFEDATTSTTSL
jgi:hypothetical protein